MDLSEIIRLLGSSHVVEETENAKTCGLVISLAQS